MYLHNDLTCSTLTTLVRICIHCYMMLHDPYFSVHPKIQICHPHLLHCLVKKEITRDVSSDLDKSTTAMTALVLPTTGPSHGVNLGTQELASMEKFHSKSKVLLEALWLTS